MRGLGLPERHVLPLRAQELREEEQLRHPLPERRRLRLQRAPPALERVLNGNLPPRDGQMSIRI